MSTKATVINFTLAPTGLQNQMLGLVVATERPDLEEQKNELIVSSAKMKAEVKALEELILKLLSECEGSPIDDQDLIQVISSRFFFFCLTVQVQTYFLFYSWING